jgi:hypothetical protein
MIVVLVFLAVVWAAVIAMWIRDRVGSRAGDSTLTFARQLSTLGRRVGGPNGRPGLVATRSPGQLARAAARKRRRDVLSTLLAAFGVTLVFAASLRSIAAIWAFALVALLLGSYLALLIHVQRSTIERRAKVRYLQPRHHPPTPAPQEPAVLLRRSATN